MLALFSFNWMNFFKQNKHLSNSLKLSCVYTQLVWCVAYQQYFLMFTLKSFHWKLKMRDMKHWKLFREKWVCSLYNREYWCEALCFKEKLRNKNILLHYPRASVFLRNFEKKHSKKSKKNFTSRMEKINCYNQKLSDFNLAEIIRVMHEN